MNENSNTVAMLSAFNANKYKSNTTLKWNICKLSSPQSAQESPKQHHPTQKPSAKSRVSPVIASRVPFQNKKRDLFTAFVFSVI